MSDSEDSVEETTEVTQKENTNSNEPEENLDRKNLPKHLKKRYWNSWEEMKLVELWRLHFNEIVDLDHNLPIFRTLTAAMREFGFYMSAQDVRRRIKYMKNKYIGERRRLSRPKEADKEPEWRLYRLIHCIMEPRQKNADLFWEQKQLAEINEKNKSNPLYQMLLKGVKIDEEIVERIERGETIEMPGPAPTHREFNFPLENKMVAAAIHVGYKNIRKLTFTPRVHRHNEEMAAQAQMLEEAVKALSSKNEIINSVENPSITSLPTQSLLLQNSSTSSLKQQQQPIKTQPGILCGRGILKRNATKSSLDQIRAENRILSDELIVSTKRLRQEEQKLKNYELTIAQVAKVYANIFQKLEISDNFDFQLMSK